MSKDISKSNMFNMAQAFKDYVENNGGVPYKYNYGGIDYYTKDMTWIFTYGLYHLKSNPITVRDNIAWCKNANGDNIVENIYTDDYKNQALRVHNYIITNGQVPNNVKTTKSKKTVNIDLYTYCMAKILVYYKNHGQLPNYCSYNYKDLAKKSKPKSYSQEILDYFVSKFGSVSSIDGALGKIQSRGYGYYYDDRYSNKQSIDRIKNGYGVNCTDACHVFWHIGKALGYDVRAIHVKCRGGDGHIRLQFNKGGGWFNRDPASILDGTCIECIWCADGTQLAVNPQWFLNNLNR